MSRRRASLDALAAMAWADRVLASRQRGHRVEAPDWLCGDAVQSLELALDGNAPLAVALRDGVPARGLPASLRPPGLQGNGWPLQYRRAPVCRAHAEAPVLTLERGRRLGTAAALVRDRLAPERQYLLTCGHVVAPDRAARAGDGVTVALGGQTFRGCLCEWQPAIGEGCPSTELDAALVEIDAATLQRLLQTVRQQGDVWLPTGLDDVVEADRPVALQRSAAQGGTPLDGRLTSFWSGQVLVGDDDFPDYFLRQAIGYRTDPGPQPGDSGAAVWSVGDKLFAMHVAGLDEGSSRFGANGVLVRVRPALDWYAVKPWLRNNPATLTEADQPVDAGDTLDAPPPDEGDDAARDLLVLTQTLWGEARGETDDGMEAVAAVILNRFNVRWRGARTVADVCLAKSQFSCWNPGDPNRPAIARVTKAPDDDFRRAEGIARRALGQAGPSIAPLPADVRHYYAVSLRDLPPWARSRPPFRQIGRHVFHAGIS
ncbi:MAG: cell wall hydrolase [Rubrivivax sp.]